MVQPIACLQFCHKCLLCDKNYIKGKGGQRPFLRERKKICGRGKRKYNSNTDTNRIRKEEGDL